MKYEVTFSCGHTGTVQLYGKGDEHGRVCPDTNRAPFKIMSVRCHLQGN